LYSPGAVHVVSTISVAFAEELVAAHERAGVGLVSAPVLGRLDVAAEGNLSQLPNNRRATAKLRP
jgi:3-hydroxyisobutyrate dehydrogenase-like beta-hydroxyacid dehydrogenase